MGFEEFNDSQGKTQAADSVPLLVPLSLSIEGEFLRLIEAWPTLTRDAKQAILAIVGTAEADREATR